MSSVERLWHCPAGRLYWLTLTAPNREPIYTLVGLAAPRWTVHYRPGHARFWVHYAGRHFGKMARLTSRHGCGALRHAERHLNRRSVPHA
jgi:hypothetical protein